MRGIVTASSGWARRILLVLGLAAGLYQLVANVAFLLVLMGAVPHGRIAMTLGVCARDRFCEVKAVGPGAASAAGLRAGDQLRFDRTVEAMRQETDEQELFAGDRIGATIRRGERTRHVEMIAAPSPWNIHPAALTSDKFLVGVAVLIVIVGLFVMMRAGSRLSVLLLGAGVACIGATDVVPFWWWRDPLAFRAFTAWSDVTLNAGALLVFAFAREFRREASGQDGALARWALWGLIIVTGAWMVFGEVVSQTGLPGPDELTSTWLWILLTDVPYALAVLTLALGWRDAPRPEKKRYGYVVPAVLMITMRQILDVLASIAGNFDPTNNPVVLGMDVLPLAGLLLLVYAVLRHKVIDLGFAVNRTLVYGVVSAVLLAAFGLIEWAVDHFVPIEGREKNALVDAAIAVGVFLTFHRVRDAVEGGVEGLFFRRWQRAEADLRRFVREAAFITEGPALSEAFVRALGQFGEGAQATVYLQDGRGYARASGQVDRIPGEFDANLPALVRLRADLKPLEVEEGALAACLIAPMVNRNEMIGVALLGPKPSGVSYRPDEIELVGWAARQIGLDLHALKVEQLEAANVDLSKTVAVLERSLALRPA